MSSIKNAVIAVAGMGKRLGFGKPKCLIKVCDKTILEYQLELLRQIENVFLVVGFRESEVIEFARKIRKDIIFVRNADFQHTKTLESFHLAAKIINDNAIFMDGDMIIEPKSFANFLKTAESSKGQNNITVAVSERISDDPVYSDVLLDDKGILKIFGFSYDKKTNYEWANIVCMPSYLMVSGKSHTFEHLQNLLPAIAAVIDRFEIDTLADLKIAEDYMRNNNWSLSPTSSYWY